MNGRLLAAVLITVCFGLLFWAFTQLPIEQTAVAIDWKSFHQATSNLNIEYAGTRVYNPPWALALLWPLTLLPLASSYALVAVVTFATFVISVPRNKGWLTVAGLVLLLLSYPFLRHLIDGNVEAMVVGGALLAGLALQHKSPELLAGGLLLLSAKPQESWLAIVVIVYGAWRSWPPRDLARGVGLAAAFALPFVVWKGAEWAAAVQAFPYSGTTIDSSLFNFFASLGWSPLLFATAWLAILAITVKAVWPVTQLDLARIGLLITAGMLLSTYVAGNSLVVPLALGVVPLFQRKPTIGLALAGLYFLPYVFLAQTELRLEYEHLYWTVVLLVTWAAQVWDLKTA